MAIGGMSAFIPSRKDAEVNARAFAQVRADKEREAGQGFDGSWVAHPDLVPVCREVFDAVLGDRPNQVDRRRDDVQVTADDLLNIKATPGAITEAGVRANVEVALLYLESWLRGSGAVGIHNLMEDAATAEISRSQLWQWVHNASTTDDGEVITTERVRRIIAEELAAIRAQVGEHAFTDGKFSTAAEILETVALDDEYVDFLTLPAYRAVS
jgi:malate synthase